MKADYYKSLLKRVDEMRRNMENFASDLEKGGIEGMSVNAWRDALDRQEAEIQKKLDEVSNARGS